MDVYKRDGVSEAGAPMYKSKWNKPPIWVAALYLFEAMALLFGVIIVTNTWQWSVSRLPQLFGSSGAYFLCGGFIMFGISAIKYACSALWMLKTRYQMRHLQTPDQIRTQMGMDDDLFYAWREEQTIKPHININGTDYYRPADFVDAGTLLRASAQPVTSETLLRPAASMEQDAGEQLLRASE